MNKIYVIWIWWIWTSAIARYYNENWYKVYGSDLHNSELIEKLENEWIDIIIWSDKSRINENFDLIIYTEAIPKDQEELKKAKEIWLKVLSYPKALSEVANKSKLITVAWTHWKSTTTSLISLVLKNSEENFSSVVGTILAEFNSKNFFNRIENKNSKNYFVIEACEYKRSFLNYKPYLWVITNIDLDPLDYYKDLKDYISAFKEYIDNIVPWWFCIINAMDDNCKELIWKRKDIEYIELYHKYFIFKNQIHTFPEINMKIPGDHVLFDAYIAYVVWHMIWIKDKLIIEALENYNWVWRRMEIVGKTKNENIIMSDYGHHPTEVKATLKALKDQNPAKPILTIFQPHQYSRTLELLEWFKTCFYDTDQLIIPNIYESRDSEEDKKKINSKKLIKYIKHDNKQDWEWFENTLKLIENWDKNNSYWIILLLGAWDIDNLRNKIKTD